MCTDCTMMEFSNQMSRRLVLATSFLSSCPIWSAYCQSRKEQPINPVTRSPTTEWNENWDGRAHETHPHPEIKHQIILIRHGQYLSHLKEREDSQILSDKGFQQVKLTGSRLAGLLDQGIFYPINSISYSTMIRATQTWIEIEKELAKAKLPSPAMIEPCSLIREVVPFPPIPHEEWALREEVFYKDQQRVSLFHYPLHFMLFYESSRLRPLSSSTSTVPPGISNPTTRPS